MTHYLSFIQESVRNNWSRLAVCNYGGKEYSYGDFYATIKKYHIIFEELGIKKGDKIALCMLNSAEWACVFVAIESYGAIAVPLLYDFTADSTSKLVEHSESKFLFTDKKKWGSIKDAEFKYLSMATTVDLEILYSVNEQESNEDFISGVEKKFFDEYPDGISAADVHFTIGEMDDIAIISYTSGTTNDPKGVMLTNKNISSNIQYGLDNIPNAPGDNVLSMLPLAHMFGMAFEFLYPLAGGCTVYFLGKTPTPQILMKALSEVKPYLVLTVPLVVEKIFRKSVIPVISKQPVKFLMSNFLTRGFVSKKILNKLLSFFGGKMRVLIIGGAALNEEIDRLMSQIKMPYTIGYGMTECAPILGYKDWRKFKKGSCGSIVDRMEIKINSENPEKISGEILVKGDNVMTGYYKNPKATKESFEDGWLKTGDMGTIDAKGNIFINGRCKSMILSESGQNIYPEEIEDKLNNLPYILETIVVGRKNKLVALIYPDRKSALESSIDEVELEKLMKDNIDLVNKELPIYSKIAEFELLVESFKKTPKMSIKRFLYK